MLQMQRAFPKIKGHTMRPYNAQCRHMGTMGNKINQNMIKHNTIELKKLIGKKIGGTLLGTLLGTSRRTKH